MYIDNQYFMFWWNKFQFSKNEKNSPKTEKGYLTFMRQPLFFEDNYIQLLNHSLVKHSMGYFHETSDVGSFYIVDVVSFLSVLETSVVDGLHNLV